MALKSSREHGSLKSKSADYRASSRTICRIAHGSNGWRVYRSRPWARTTATLRTRDRFLNRLHLTRHSCHNVGAQKSINRAGACVDNSCNHRSRANRRGTLGYAAVVVFDSVCYPQCCSRWILLLASMATMNELTPPNKTSRIKENP